MFLKISLVIFSAIFLILFIPSGIQVKLNIVCNRFFLDIKKISGLESKITYKLCGIIPLYNKKLFEKKKVVKKQKENKLKKVFNNKNTIFTLLKKSYIDKFVFSLGFNLDDPIANSYVNASLNTILCMYINANQNKFNLKKLYYQTYVGENLAKFNIDCIIKISLADTIKVIVKEYFRLLKDENRKDEILKFEKRSEQYGRASD